MTEKFINIFDPLMLKEIISSAEERIYLSLPNIHIEFAKELIEANSKISDIRIVIDVSENNFRNGYGDIDAIEKLRTNNIIIFESPKNRVSFIICDNKGYFIFPESRIFAYDDVGNNAVKMDPLTQLHLVEYFFPTAESKDGNNSGSLELKEYVEEATKDYIKFVEETIEDIEEPKNHLEITPLNVEKLNQTKINLEQIPPVHPDLQRQIQTYTTKIQFVELNFEGANLQFKKVNLPPKAMPFKDKEIKKALETKMRLFDDLKSNEKFNEFFNTKEDVETVRKKYCVPITCRKKSILFISKREDFVKEIKRLKKNIKKVNESIPQYLDEEILKSKKRIRIEIGEFLKTNPPDEIKNYQPSLFNDKIDDIVNGILNSIKYPDPNKIIAKMSLKENFYNLTYEDFENDDFLKELEGKEIMKKGEIDKIVSFRDAFQAKNPNSQNSVTK